jgi:hypothetical protein
MSCSPVTLNVITLLQVCIFPVPNFPSHVSVHLNTSLVLPQHLLELRILELAAAVQVHPLERFLHGGIVTPRTMGVYITTPLTMEILMEPMRLGVLRAHVHYDQTVRMTRLSGAVLHLMSSALYTQGRSSHLPIPTLRLSCYELGPLLSDIVLGHITRFPASREPSSKACDAQSWSDCMYPSPRGLRPSTFQPNVSTFRGIRWVVNRFKCQKWLRLS